MGIVDFSKGCLRSDLQREIDERRCILIEQARKWFLEENAEPVLLLYLVVKPPNLGRDLEAKRGKPNTLVKSL